MSELLRSELGEKALYYGLLGKDAYTNPEEQKALRGAFDVHDPATLSNRKDRADIFRNYEYLSRRLKRGTERNKENVVLAVRDFMVGILEVPHDSRQKVISEMIDGGSASGNGVPSEPSGLTEETVGPMIAHNVARRWERPRMTGDNLSVDQALLEAYSDSRSRELASHLEEVEEYATSFVLDSEGHSKMEWLSDRQARLFAHVVAPMHDMLKYLGTMKGQIWSDHEKLVEKLVRDTFVGKSVTFTGADGNQEQITMNDEDVEYIAGVVGDHENLYKEEGRRDFIRAVEDTDLKTAVVRSKALFFVVDTMTSVISMNEKSRYSINTVELDRRFTDLYFRHLEPNFGKTFRPEWGLDSIEDIITTLKGVSSADVRDLRGDLSPLYLSLQTAIGMTKMMDEIAVYLNAQFGDTSVGGSKYENMMDLVTKKVREFSREKGYFINDVLLGNIYSGLMKKFNPDRKPEEPWLKEPLKRLEPEQMAKLVTIEKTVLDKMA